MWLKRVMMMRVHLPSCGSLISLTPGHCDPHAAPPHTHTRTTWGLREAHFPECSGMWTQEPWRERQAVTQKSDEQQNGSVTSLL